MGRAIKIQTNGVFFTFFIGPMKDFGYDISDFREIGSFCCKWNFITKY